MSKSFKIWCSSCERTVTVYGKIWAFRLRHSEQDDKGRFLGWRCDSCADLMERGGY